MRWTPLFSKLYPHCVWQMPSKDNAVYLTFDDGPTPIVTDEVLALLDKYDAKASFFVIGKNVVAYPDIYERIVQSGHTIGNHTFHHEKGWKTNTETYLHSIAKTALYVQSDLFRPPYGRISKAQINALKNTTRIIMWDLLSYDYDQGKTPEQCTHIVLKNIRPGSIVVFHDSEKAKKNMLPTLEACLAYCKKNRLIPEALPTNYYAYCLSRDSN